MKRLLSLLASAAVAAGALTATAAPATAAAGSCSIAMPSTLAITNPYTRFSIPLAADCRASGTVYASWDMVNARTGDFAGILIYDAETGSMGPELLEWYDDYDGFGAFYLDPSLAWDANDDTVQQNNPVVTVKAASKASQSTSRRGNTVTVTVGASYYSARSDRQIPWPGAGVQIQTSNALNGRWTTVATVTTGADGLASKAIHAPSARYWRVLTPTTKSVFGRYSTPVYR